MYVRIHWHGFLKAEKALKANRMKICMAEE